LTELYEESQAKLQESIDELGIMKQYLNEVLEEVKELKENGNDKYHSDILLRSHRLISISTTTSAIVKTLLNNRDCCCSCCP
jgi:hypothetical protein